MRTPLALATTAHRLRHPLPLRGQTLRNHIPQKPSYIAFALASTSAPRPPPKHCIICGRLISANHAHFAERKRCSSACRGTRLGPLDARLEELFVSLARDAGRAGVPTCTVEEIVYPELQPVSGEAAGGGILWRERVRMAARRVVVLRREGGEEFECVQNGRVVEPSFAKGMFAVRCKS